MMSNNDKISPYQIAMLLIATIISVGVFSIAQDMTENAGTNGWIIILIAGGFNILAAFIIITLNSRFPGKTLAEYSPFLIGKFPTRLLLLVFSIYLLIVLAFETRSFTEVIKMFLLFRTPAEVIMLSLLLVTTYIVRGGIECIARLAELIFPLLFIPFIFILLPGLGTLDYTNLMPLFQDLPNKMVAATPALIYNFGGMELLLFFVGFMDNPKKAYKPAAAAMAFIAVFLSFITVVCTAAFGEKATQQFLWPLLTYIRNVNLPGLFIERLDGIALSLWVMTVFTTLICVLFVASYSLSKAIGTREHKQYVLPLVIMVYYLALQPDSLVQLLTWGERFFPYASSMMMYGLPVVLLIIAYLRRKGVGGFEKT